MQTELFPCVNTLRSSIISIILPSVVAVQRVTNCRPAELQPITIRTPSILHVSDTKFPRDEYTAVRSGCETWRDVLCWKPEHCCCTLPLHPTWQPWQSSSWWVSVSVGKEGGINQRITNHWIAGIFMRTCGATLTPGLGSDKYGLLSPRRRELLWVSEGQK